MILSDWLYGVLVGIAWIAWVLLGVYIHAWISPRPPAQQAYASRHLSQSPGLWASADPWRASHPVYGWIAARANGAAGLTPVS